MNRIRRHLLAHLLLLQAVIGSGCATTQVNDQWLEHSARENERTAEVWRKAGEPSQATKFEQQAERDRQAAKKNSTSWLEALIDSVLIGWIDGPQQARQR